MILFLQKHTWRSLSKKVRLIYTENGQGSTYHNLTTYAPWKILKTIWDWSILTSAPVNIFPEPSLNVKSHDYTGKTKVTTTQEKQTYLIHYDSPKFIKGYKSCWVKLKRLWLAQSPSWRGIFSCKQRNTG